MNLIKGSNIYIWERSAILIFIGLYLYIFNVTIPHGDALRIVRQIDADQLIWNPNHLLLDTFGYLWVQILSTFSNSISILGSFELISAISTLLSMLLFHKILMTLGVKHSVMRLLLVLGLFSSKNFLSMSVSQYFFMMQMPFLLGSLYFGILHCKNMQNGENSSLPLYAMGVLLAIATGIEINNVVPIILLGLALATISTREKAWDLSNVVKFWGAAAVTGFPMFLIGYYASGTDSGFFSWLLSYGGETDSSLDNYYGIQMTLIGVLSSGASLVFHLFFGNIIETAGLGTVIKALVLQQPLEFVPNYTKITLSLLLMPVVGLTLLVVFVWSLRHIKKLPIVRISLAWLLGYLIFNFIWPYTSDLFWFHMLPLVWLLVISNLGLTNTTAEIDSSRAPAKKWQLSVLTLTIFCLLVLNTIQTVVPVSSPDIENNRVLHDAMIHEGDLEIVPGWDNYKWMMQDSDGKPVNKLLLANMVLNNKNADQHISRLPEIVGSYLQDGKRVIVGRLYNLDRESNPWYGLSDLGWPRSKIQELLSSFCKQKLATIDDVEFYQLHQCSN